MKLKIKIDFVNEFYEIEIKQIILKSAHLD